MTPVTVEDIAVEIRRLGWDKCKIESWVATFHVMRLSQMSEAQLIEAIEDLRGQS